MVLSLPQKNHWHFDSHASFIPDIYVHMHTYKSLIFNTHTSHIPTQELIPNYAFCMVFSRAFNNNILLLYFLKMMVWVVLYRRSLQGFQEWLLRCFKRWYFCRLEDWERNTANGCSYQSHYGYALVDSITSAFSIYLLRTISSNSSTLQMKKLKMRFNAFHSIIMYNFQKVK